MCKKLLFHTALVLTLIFSASLPTTTHAKDVGEEDATDYGTVSGQIRYYYFTQRDKDDWTTVRHVKESLAIGGFAKYETPWLADHVQLGLAAYGSFPFPQQFNHAAKGGTSMLTPKNNSIVVLGEAFARVRQGETVGTAYRQRIETPMVNGNDSRMLPHLYEAYTVESKDFSDLRLMASWVERVKLRDTSVFTYMSEASGASGMGTTERGMMLLGGDWSPEPFKTRAWFYAIPDYMQMVFLEAGGKHPVGDDLSVHWKAQGLDQRSIGDSDAGGFHVGEAGLLGGVTVSGVTMEVGGTIVDNTVNILNKYGTYPFFNNMMAYGNNRAGEKALFLGLSYDFKRIDWDGFTASLKTSIADTPSSGKNAAPDRREYNLNMNYNFSGDWEGLSILNRWSYQEAIGDKNGMQVRLRLQYNF